MAQQFFAFVSSIAPRPIPRQRPRPRPKQSPRPRPRIILRIRPRLSPRPRPKHWQSIFSHSFHRPLQDIAQDLNPDPKDLDKLLNQDPDIYKDLDQHQDLDLESDQAQDQAQDQDKDQDSDVDIGIEFFRIRFIDFST